VGDSLKTSYAIFSGGHLQRFGVTLSSPFALSIPYKLVTGIQVMLGLINAVASNVAPYLGYHVYLCLAWLKISQGSLTLAQKQTSDTDGCSP